MQDALAGTQHWLPNEKDFFAKATSVLLYKTDKHSSLTSWHSVCGLVCVELSLDISLSEPTKVVVTYLLVRVKTMWSWTFLLSQQTGLMLGSPRLVAGIGAWVNAFTVSNIEAATQIKVCESQGNGIIKPHHSNLPLPYKWLTTFSATLSMSYNRQFLLVLEFPPFYSKGRVGFCKQQCWRRTRPHK